jgi:hypothetical protein
VEGRKERKGRKAKKEGEKERETPRKDIEEERTQ